jgi:hypothetical protein
MSGPHDNAIAYETGFTGAGVCGGFVKQAEHDDCYRASNSGG